MKLSTKITLLVIMLALLFAITSMISVSWLMRERLNANQEEWVINLVHGIAEGISLNTINGNVAHVQEQLHAIVDRDEVLDYAFVMDFEEHLFASSFEHGFPRLLMETAHSQVQDGQSYNRFLTTQGEILDIARPLIEGMRAHVHIGVNQKEINTLIRDTQKDILLTVLLVSLVGVTCSLLVSRRISAPLHRLSKWMHGYGRGEEKNGPDIGKADVELNELATTFRRMVKDRAEMDAARRESEAQIKLLMDSTGEAIYGLDIEGNCTFANATCIRMLGYEHVSEVMWQNMHMLIHHTRIEGIPYPASECPIYQAYQEGRDIHVDDEVLWRKDGSSFQAEYWSHPIRHDGETVGAVVTFVDITERKLIEKELGLYREHLERLVLERTNELEKRTQELLIANESLENFCHTVAHDLRGPLTPILGFADLLLSDHDISLASRETIENINASATKMSGLINELLNLAKSTRSKLKLEPVNLSAMGNEILEGLRMVDLIEA